MESVVRVCNCVDIFSVTRYRGVVNMIRKKSFSPTRFGFLQNRQYMFRFQVFDHCNQHVLLFIFLQLKKIQIYHVHKKGAFFTNQSILRILQAQMLKERKAKFAHFMHF